MRKIDLIVVHCSDTRKDWMRGHSFEAKVREIARWHTARPPEGNGWRAIGYHYIIGRDGQIANGRPLEKIGAHVRRHNKHSIGICLLGGHGGAATDSFSDHFTAEQAKALDVLIGDLKKRFGPVAVAGHNDFAGKACPCFDVHAWMAGRIVEPHIIDEPYEVHDEPHIIDEPAGFFESLIAAIARIFR